MNNEMIKKVLAQFSLFQDLCDEELNKVVSVALTREWQKGSLVFQQGEQLRNVYFIYKGKIKVYKTDIQGKEQIVSIQKTGDMFPHIGFFRKGDYPAFAEVMENATMIVIPISGFEQVLLDNPSMCIKVFNVLGEKIVDLQNRLEEQILNNTYEQIVKLLIRLSKDHGHAREDGSILLKSEFTKKEMASMIGTTRETVSRTLTKLKQDEVVAVDKDGSMIINPDRLLQEII